MAEGSQIDWRSHDNDFIGMIAQMDEFNETVNAAIDFAESRDDTLVLVTSDHETGGLLIEQDNKRYQACLLYTSPSPRDVEESRMPSSA